MSRKRGGLRLLPPFGSNGEYEGIVDALENVRGYIEDIKQDYVALMRGSLAASIDLGDVMYRHVHSGADVTAVCTSGAPEGVHHRFLLDGDGFVKEILLRRSGPGEGGGHARGLRHEQGRCCSKSSTAATPRSTTSSTATAWAALSHAAGRSASICTTRTTANIMSVDGYYRASMDMLDRAKRRELFPEDRPVRTKAAATSSTYYGRPGRQQEQPGGGRLHHRGLC